jgi:hypothetical protein
VTFTGSTHNTGTTNGLILFQPPTYTDTSAVTMDHAATLIVGGAPSATGSLTITKPLSLWIQSGTSELDGSLTVLGDLLTDGALTFSGYAGGNGGFLGVNGSGFVGVLPGATETELTYYSTLTIATVIATGTAWLATSNQTTNSATAIEYPSNGTTPTYARIYVYPVVNTLSSGALVICVTHNGSLGGSSGPCVSYTGTGGVLDSGTTTISRSTSDVFGVSVAGVSSPTASSSPVVTVKVRLSSVAF